MFGGTMKLPCLPPATTWNSGPAPIDDRERIIALFLKNAYRLPTEKEMQDALKLLKTEAR